VAESKDAKKARASYCSPIGGS